MSLHAYMTAHAKGFDETCTLIRLLALMSRKRAVLTSFCHKDGTLVTPKSDSILPSITRRSLITIAEDMLGMKVEHRPVAFSEVADFAEAGLCGTAAVICPVGRVVDHGKVIDIKSGMDEMGPVLTKLYKTLRGIQMGEIEGPKGWIHEVK